MNNPALVNITDKDTWYLVAENVANGAVSIKTFSAEDYYYTYKLTGQAAPANSNTDTAIQIHSEQLLISSTAAIDVYIRCNFDSGSVVVSI